MEIKKIDILIWRSIGILILLGASAILLMGSFAAAVAFYQYISSDSQTDIIANVADDPEDKEKWVLGSASEISGTEYLFIPLISENKEVSTVGLSKVKSEYKSMFNTESKNILFINSKDNASRWLFESNNQLISDISQFPETYYGQGSGNKTRAIFYQIYNQDTNNDGIINYDDTQSLAVTRANGSDFTIFLTQFDKIISRTTVSNDKALIVYQHKNVGYSLLYDIEKNKILSNLKLPQVKNP